MGRWEPDTQRRGGNFHAAKLAETAKADSPGTVPHLALRQAGGEAGDQRRHQHQRPARARASSFLRRRAAVVARQAHNLEVVRSTRTVATRIAPTLGHTTAERHQPRPVARPLFFRGSHRTPSGDPGAALALAGNESEPQPCSRARSSPVSRYAGAEHRSDGMRLSAIQGDPGYPVFRGVRKAGLWPVVTVDGQRIHGALTADDRRGYVLAPDLDAAGKYQLTARRSDIKCKQLRGKVEIMLERRP